jgi:hypothetical protein
LSSSALLEDREDLVVSDLHLEMVETVEWEEMVMVVEVVVAENWEVDPHLELEDQEVMVLYKMALKGRHLLHLQLEVMVGMEDLRMEEEAVEEQ